MSLTCIVTRPENQANSLMSALERLGHNAVHIPSIQIQPIPQSSPIQPSSIVIFLSANAALHSQHLWPSKNFTCIAIGPGTKNTLLELGQNVIHTPENFSSEGLLELPILRNVTGKSITICCGRNPRPLIFQALTKRGAKIKLVECYQRIPSPIDPSAIQTLKPHLVITTSAEGLNNFFSHHAELTRIPTLVIHKKHQSIANMLGIKQVLVSPSAVTEDIIKTIRQHQSMLENRAGILT